jgi:protein phosphatase
VIGGWSFRDLWRRPRATVTVTAAAASHIGRVRDHNEDYFLIVDLLADDSAAQPPDSDRRMAETGCLLVVADGMGGAAAGEVASEMAANVIFSQLAGRWRDRGARSAGRVPHYLVDAIEAANREIHAYARERPELKGMGTTATAAAVLDGRLYVGHVGDSRAYLVRDGQARRITKDHSLTQHLMDTGALTPEAAATSPQRSTLLRALGPAQEVAVDFSHERLQPGDLLVLCSDGLWSSVAELEIGCIAKREPHLVTACERLVALANERGGHDNVTVLIARFAVAGRVNGDTRPRRRVRAESSTS